MSFPDITKFPHGHIGCYERRMGECIVELIDLFAGRVVDVESREQVRQLAETPERWSAGHAVFDEIRRRLLEADKAKDTTRQAQYCFEESCCKAMYNASEPIDPFDPSSAFFVVPSALYLAQHTGVALDAIAKVFASNAG